MRKIFGTTKKSSIDWEYLTSESSLQEAILSSSDKPVIIFKHSTRCSISSMAKSRLESSWDAQEMEGTTPYFLDLIAHRDISDLVAETFGVYHESPQILVIKNGKCTFDTSHMNISYKTVKQNTLSS